MAELTGEQLSYWRAISSEEGGVSVVVPIEQFTVFLSAVARWRESEARAEALRAAHLEQVELVVRCKLCGGGRFAEEPECHAPDCVARPAEESR